MGAYGLPALHVNPPQQGPGPLEQYGQLAQLRAMMGQQQLQQQQIQGAQLENQVRQRQVQDQNAMTQAMQEWDGKDINQLPALVLKHHGSANAVLGLKSSLLDYQTKLNGLTTSQLANEKQVNDMIAGHLDALKQLPLDQQPAGFEQAKQDLAQKLPPQYQQQIAGIQYQGPQQLDVLEKMFMGHSAQVDQALKQSEIAKNTAQANAATATVAKTQAEMQYYKDNGGAPGVPTETVQMNSWLKNNPGKTPADFLEHKATLVPQFNFNLQNTGTTGDAAAVAKRFGMTPVAFDQAAEKYWSSGQLPPSGRGGPALALNKAIQNRAADLHPEGSLAANSAEYKANTEALKKVQSQFDTVNAFENTAIKNLDMLQQKAQAVPELGARFANTPIRMISEKMIGSPEMAQFRAALQTAQTETAKVLNSANASGVVSDSARGELQQLLNGNLPYKSMVSAIETLKQDMQNRHDSYQQQIQDIQGRLGGKAQTTAPQSNQSAPGGDFWSQFPVKK